MDIERTAPVDARQRTSVALHGPEPAGCQGEVRHALTPWPRDALRVLGVTAPPAPASIDPVPLRGRRPVTAGGEA